MSALFVIPDVQSLARRVAKENPNTDRSHVYGAVFEFIRFFRLKQKLNDFDPSAAILAPSFLIDSVWHIFIQDTVQYQQACGHVSRFIHHDPNGKQDSTYYARLKRTREEYIKEYHEPPPNEFWLDEIVLAPATPPGSPSSAIQVISPPSTPVLRRRMSTRSVQSSRKRDRETTFTLFVKRLNGKTHTMPNISSEMTVKQFREEVSRDSGVPPSAIRLIFAGVSLDDDHKFSECGILSDATIHMVERLRGC